MGIVIETKSKSQTQKVGRLLARSIAESAVAGPVVVALEGELGSGKTTFVQGFAWAVGIGAPILSPTFVLIKTYPLPKLQTTRFAKASARRANYKLRTLIHVDCYRLQKPQELIHIGFREIIKNPHAVILIEWADRVKKLISPGAFWIRFEHGKRANERRLTIESRIENQESRAVFFLRDS